VGKIFRTAETVNKSSKTARLALALLRDRERPSAVNSTTTCFLCGRSYTYGGPSGDDSGRFCSVRCRENYDAGKRPQSSPQLYSLRPGKTGFYITCAGCAREFESLGLRCCTPECERAYRERSESRELMAEVGMAPVAKRICENEGCNRPIPTWRGGRRVSKTVRFCSQKCQRASRSRRTA
jgi:hypothetical protein